MAMHSNWNPWHGCIKCSEGCQNCYVYPLHNTKEDSFCINTTNLLMDLVVYRLLTKPLIA